MSELCLTIAGVLVATLAAVYSIVIDASKSAMQRAILVAIAVVGLGLGVVGAVFQQQDGASSAEALRRLQAGVGKLNDVDQKIRAGNDELTSLNLLGAAHYYIVIGTYPNTPAGNKDYGRVLANIETFFPNAATNGMIWKHPLSNNDYQMAFGRHLSPAAAEDYLRLADYLAGGQHPIMRLEP